MSETFWDFSLRTYRTDKVPEACLSLQDEREVDVNMMLFCLWYGVTRGQQEALSFENVFEFSETWARRVVRPLRHVRIWMKINGCHDPRVSKESCMEFRKKVKGVEFTAEKMQQDVLESIVGSVLEKEIGLPVQLDAVVKNIQQYFSVANIVSDDFVRERLLTIIKAGVVDFSEKEIQNALKTNI